MFFVSKASPFLLLFYYVLGVGNKVAMFSVLTICRYFGVSLSKMTFLCVLGDGEWGGGGGRGAGYVWNLSKFSVLLGGIVRMWVRTFS